MTQEPGFDPIADVCHRIAFARHLYLADLQAMPDEMLRRECGGKARTGYDVTFELTMMYEDFASLLIVGEGSIQGPRGWVQAPDVLKDAEGARAAFRAAIDRFVAALRDYSGNTYTDEYDSPFGGFTPIGMANLVVWHTMYHSGQLNFIQTLCGDDTFHWMP